MGYEKCGNRTNSYRETSHLTALSERYSNEVDSYRRMAEGRRSRRICQQEKAYDMLTSIMSYVDEKKAEGKPMTISGIILSAKISRKVYDCAKNGDYDYVMEEWLTLNGHTDDEIEYIDGLPFIDGVLMMPFSEIFEIAELLVQEQRESACSSLKGNPVGNIFLLKSQQGFKEDSSPQTVNQTLVIADADKAKEALKLLGE